MSTHVELRLPRVEIDVPDLALVTAPVAGIGTSETAALLDAGGRRAPLSGLQSSSVEVAVRLCGDALALAVAVAIVGRGHPALVQGMLWVLGGLASFAATGLYVHRLRCRRWMTFLWCSWALPSAWPPCPWPLAAVCATQWSQQCSAERSSS